MKRSVQSKNLAVMCASAAVIAMMFGAPSPKVFGQTVISDTQFNDSDWTEQILANNNPTDWTYSAQQYTTGGNPDAFRGQTWQYLNNDGAAVTTLTTADLYTGQTFDPATQGSFQFVNYSMDDSIADVMGGSGNRVISFGPALEQNGSVYLTSGVVSSNIAWTTNSWPGGGISYGAGAFNLFSGNGPAHPDFSANAAPITFGYYDSLNVGPSNSPYNLFHGVDNFNVQLIQNSTTGPTTGQYIVNADIGYTDAAHSYSGQAGIPAPGNNWNIVSSGTTGPVGGFQDSQGNPTSVGYFWKTGPGLQLLSPIQLVSDVFDSNYTALVDDGSFNGVEGNLTPDIYGGEMYITGLLPDGHYNLALYGIAYSAITSTTYLTKFTVNGTSQIPQGPIDNDTEGGNYIQDNNVIADANGEIRVQLHNANYLDPNTGLLEGGIYTMNGFQVQSLDMANPTWTGGSGNWSAAGSWTNGMPTGPGSIAEFDNASAPVNVNLDGPQTIGVLGFSSSQKFTLSGSAITLDGNGYDSMINVSSGSHEIAAPINVANGEAEIIIADNASLKLSGKLTGQLSRVQLGTASTLDITDNSLVVEYFGNDPYSELLANTSTAFDQGKWDGTGLTSSETATPGVAIGIVDNAAAGWTSFDGQTLADTSNVLIAPTWYGDANMDGVVDATDLGLMSAGESGALTGWQNGDFNYDGVVNADDSALFMLGFSLQTGAIGAAVPEPAGAVLLLAAAPLLMRRRRHA